jgi:hypothetical protein
MADEIKIESDIAKPDGGAPRRGYSRYPLDKMKVGDSFLMPGAGEVTLATLKARAYRAIRTRRESQPLERYDFRAVFEGGKHGVRIWRDPDATD